jgi:hypothetical protein
MKALFAALLFFYTSITFSQTDKEKFVGQWVSSDVGYSMMCNFKADGTGVVDGDVITWSVKPGILVIEMEGDRQSYNYTFNQTGFRVSGGDLDMPLNFKKVKSGSASTSSAQTTTTNSSGKNLDQSLVGKWCYVNVASNYSTSSEQCILVNANGTYEYFAERSTSGNNGSTASQSNDAGTWWVEGDRVYYNSRNESEGSYQLIKRNHPKTGDPMIVLDGTAYVTFFKKSPWQL